MLQQSQRLDGFEIIRLLGRGGMGEVYEAQQTHPERRVALKVLAPWLAENEEALKRFWREAEVPAQLDHPAVVRIFATGQADGVAYYTMQLVRGISLASLIGQARDALRDTQSYRNGPANPSEVPTPVDAGTVDSLQGASDEDSAILREYLADRYRTLARLGVQAASALAWTHKQGYLHRDIKPSNLMVDHHNQLYLLDFGLTRALDSGLSSRVGGLIGTPYFMSPEQADGHPLDYRSDIFSLGITLYQLASVGKGPYSARREDSDAVLREVRGGKGLPLRVLAPETPPFLERIIGKATDPSPESRYQKAEELAADLEQFLSQTQARPSPPPLPVRTQGIAGRWLLTGTAGLVLALVLGGFWLSGRSGDMPAQQNEANQAENADVAGQAEGALILRPHPLRVKDPLLRDDFQPVQFKRLLRPGTFNPRAAEMLFSSPPRRQHKPALLALDDSGERNFEFSVELKAWDQTEDLTNDLGIFWGWQKPEQLKDPKERPRFFSAHLDRRSALTDVHGRLRVGTWLFEEPKDGKEGGQEQNVFAFVDSRGDLSIIPLLPPPEKFDGWYRVWVRVEKQQITVGLNDAGPRVEFDVASMQERNRWFKRFTLRPHGLLGIWARNGKGSFRNATFMALP